MTTLYVLHQQVDRSKLATEVDGMKAKIGPAGSDWYFINFRLKPPDLFKNPADDQLSNWSDATTGGRLFGPDAEVKWQLKSADKFDLWTLQEIDPGETGSGWDTLENVKKLGEETKFYCVGAWDGKAFCEGRLAVPLPYPFSGTELGNRAFFKAWEYSPSPPQLKDGEMRTKDNLQEIMDQLNQPRVLAYRLTGMGIDRGEDPPYNLGE